MKKKLLASLAAAMVLGVAGTAFAATNPFVDVPAKHWSYDAVTKLAQAGIVDGYGDGTYRGDKLISRYEMAQIVAKAMAHSDKADASQKAAIDKLAVEFASELEGLNVRVTNVESRLDNVKWGGEVRERFDRVREGTTKTSPSQTYVDMWATAQINKDWVAKVEYENSSKMLNNGISKAGADDNNIHGNTTRIFAQGTLFGGQATIGKFNPFVGYGLVIDDSMTGASLQFGNKLKARVGYGNYAGSVTSALNSVNDITFENAPSYAFGEVDYATSKVTNFKFAYHNLGFSNADANTVGQDSVHYTEAGFDTKFGKNLSLMATYVKSNVDNATAIYADGTAKDNKGYFTQLTYKAADVKHAGTYDIYTNYRKIPVASQLDSTWDYSKGVKGLQVGFDYIPAENIKINAFYLKGKDITTSTDGVDAKVYRAQVEFFF